MRRRPSHTVRNDVNGSNLAARGPPPDPINPSYDRQAGASIFPVTAEKSSLSLSLSQLYWLFTLAASFKNPVSSENLFYQSLICKVQHEVGRRS